MTTFNKHCNIIGLEKRDIWEAFISKLPLSQQDIYYTSEYYSFYEKYGDGKAQCFVFEKDGDLAIYPFLINSVNELGYDLNDDYYDIQGAYGYNGVLSSCYNPKFSNEFSRNFEEYCHDNNIVAEFTRFNPFLKNHRFSGNYMQTSLNRNTAFLNLNDSFDTIWENSYSSKNRNMIRKALNKGYKVIIDNSIIGAKEFYSMYLSTMKAIKADRYYYFNESMFIKMTRIPYFDFLFVKDNNHNKLATMILMTYCNYAHYHLSGRDSEKGDNSVNAFLLNEAVKIAKEKKAKLFHFGGGNSLDEHDSLFRFKRGFSKRFLDFFIGKKIHEQRIYNKIILQWQENHANSFCKNKHKLLGYREIL